MRKRLLIGLIALSAVFCLGAAMPPREVYLLLEPEKGELYFVEKLAGAMPYQVSKFSSADALPDYLTGMYGTLYTRDVSAPPFILLNDQPL